MEKLALLVREKWAEDATPGVVALTKYAPELASAVNADEVARPEALVVTTHAYGSGLPPAQEAKVPDTPVAGAVKVTFAPSTACPGESRTRATSSDPNMVFTAVNCGVPDTVEIEVAEFVSEMVQQKVVVGLTPCVRPTANTWKQCGPGARRRYWISP